LSWYARIGKKEIEDDDDDDDDEDEDEDEDDGVKAPLVVRLGLWPSYA
jgi:hypothetical protein